MSRIQLALNVNDLDASIAFYSHLLGTAPAKVRPSYANFTVADPELKLVLIENPGHGGELNHGERWEIYTMLADSTTFNGEPQAQSAPTATACC